MSWQAGTRAQRAVSLIAALLWAVPAFLCGLLAGWLSPVWLWAELPLWALGVGGVWWYPPRWTAENRGRLVSDHLCFARGVLWRREWTVPLSSLRECEWWEPPLHRLCGCRTLVIRYAGGAAFIPLLDREQAAALWERLEAAL